MRLPRDLSSAIRNLLLAWVLTLPMAMILAGSLCAGPTVDLLTNASLIASNARADSAAAIHTTVYRLCVGDRFQLERQTLDPTGGARHCVRRYLCCCRYCRRETAGWSRDISRLRHGRIPAGSRGVQRREDIRRRFRLGARGRSDERRATSTCSPIAGRTPTATTRTRRYSRCPRFTPQIGRFRLDGDKLVLVKAIEIKNAKGRKVTGLPNPTNGNTGEIAVDLQGRKLGTDPEWPRQRGARRAARRHVLDLGRVRPVARACRRDGPDARACRTLSGTQVAAEGARAAPPQPRHGIAHHHARRQHARRHDAEPGGQSRHHDPQDSRGSIASSSTTRAPARRSSTRYLLDSTSAVVSEIAAISNTAYLVLERDQLFPGDPKSPSKLKRIYRIDISQATDLSDPDDGRNGRLVNGKTLEQLTDAELAAAGIVPVTKELVVDLLAMPGGYPHDKSEGLAVISRPLIAVSNDDDFGIVPDGKGGIAAKRLPAGNNRSTSIASTSSG